MSGEAIVRIFVAGLVVATGILVGVPSAHAGATKCRGVIVKETRTLIIKETNALLRCWQRVADGKVPGPCPDEDAAETIADERARRVRIVAKACGGEDGICGEDTPARDEALGVLGWNIGSCAYFGNPACSNPIVDCNDISACAQCLAEDTVARVFELFFDAQAVDPGTTAGNKTLLACLKAFGKGQVGLFGRGAKEHGACWAGVNAEDSGGSFSCPVAKNLVRIAKAKEQVLRTVCKQCGGPDRKCGGGDDVSRTALGFPATCPAIGICGGPVATLVDAIDCTDCVIRFLTDAVARNTIPAYSATSPPVCVPGPTPTP